MTGSLLLRGMLLGVFAGLIAFVFAYQIGEPQVDLAIAFEEQMAAAEAPAATDGAVAEEEAPVVSRETQATTGLVTGLVGFGAAIGGIFSLVFSVAYGRLGAIGARTTAALLATAGFVSVSLVPLLKYPANPPAVGYDDTVGSRTALFFILLVISVALMTATVVLAKRLWRERGVWNASVIAGATFVVATAIVFEILPPINEMPEGFNPLVIWNFRIASLGIHLILWTVIGLGFGLAAERLLERRTGGGLAQA
ncbi:MAG: CbtA family protein [Agrobacterium sp.]|nr:CbtA family protein [Agrobacterium sp.]